MNSRVAINGFGRIGRSVFRILCDHPSIEVVCINDIFKNEALAYLLKYDTVMGTLKQDVTYDDHALYVGGKKILMTSVRNPAEAKWKELGIDVVIESTGIFTARADLEKHLHHVGVRTTVKRSRESSNARGDCSIHTCKSTGNDTCRERRRVQFVVRMQDQCDIKHPSFICLGLFAAEHIKKVFGDRKALVRSDYFLTIADTVPGGSDGADLPRDLGSGLVRVLPISTVAVLIVKIERADSRPKNIHRI